MSNEATAAQETGEAGSVSERRSQPGVITCSGCTAEWTGVSRAHCSGCHHTFTGITAFDRHRDAGGDDEPHGFCHAPDVCGLVEREQGIWGAPAMTRKQIEDAWGSTRENAR